MTGDAFVTLAIWGLGFVLVIRTIGIARALLLLGLLFLAAVRVVLGFAGSSRTR